MNNSWKKHLSGLAMLASLAVVMAPEASAAQAFPQRPITVVVGFPAGGQTDIHARLLGDAMSTILGQPIIVENRPGAGTTIAAAHVAKSRGDGYTLLYGGVSTLTLAHHTYPTLPYSHDDFQPVALIEEVPLALMVDTQKISSRNVAEYIAYAKEKAGTLNYATTGAGVITHLLGEEVQSVLGIKTPPIHYRGSAQATTDVIGGHISVIVDGLGNATPYLREGRLRALGVSSGQRLRSLPDVPTFAEQGYPALHLAPWAGLLAPADTPPEVVQTLHAAAVKAMASTELRDRFMADGTIPLDIPAAEMKDKVARDHKLWSDIAVRLNLNAR
jgi:tripartite-type tricarboxylate transporter receptor subunit TctC